MIYRQYKFEQFSVQKEDLLYFIDVKDYRNTSPEQINLFTVMINFGYMPVESDHLSFTDRQIAEFWEYGKGSVLKNMNLSQYYSNFGIAPVFTSKIPTLKTSGAFFSDKYETKVTWINDTSAGKIASSPQSYKRVGLELFSMEDELKGSITPDYFDLYMAVDNANARWSKMTKSEKYSFLVELSSIADRTKFAMPTSLKETLTALQG